MLYFVTLQIQTEKMQKSLKAKLAAVAPLVEDLKTKKEERMKQFADMKAQIEKISGEISGYSHLDNGAISSFSLDDHDLSLRKLNEFQTHLRTLQKEKVIIPPSQLIPNPMLHILLPKFRSMC